MTATTSSARPVLPLPVSTEPRPGRFILTDDLAIATDQPGWAAVVRRLLSPGTGLELPSDADGATRDAPGAPPTAAGRSAPFCLPWLDKRAPTARPNILTGRKCCLLAPERRLIIRIAGTTFGGVRNGNATPVICLAGGRRPIGTSGGPLAGRPADANGEQS